MSATARCIGRVPLARCSLLADRVCCIGRSWCMRSARLARRRRSNCHGQLAERGGESKVVGLVGGDLVVAAA
jgi:hypothetical protein